MNSQAEAKKHVPPPNGLDINDYLGNEDWDYRRWAWEYLRRNLEFRVACADLPKDKEQRRLRKREISKTYLLRRFKHCDEPYTTDRPAQFRALRTSPRPARGEAMEWAIALEPDEVAIVFKLRPSFFGKSALDTQLEKAKKIIERRVLALKAQLEANGVAKNSTVDRAAHLHRIRVVDARRSGKSWQTIAEALRTRTDGATDVAYLTGC